MELAFALDSGWESRNRELSPLLLSPTIPRLRWVIAPAVASAAHIAARLGNETYAAELLQRVIPAIERAPAGASNYQRLINSAARAQWESEDNRFARVIEEHLHDKVLSPDFRSLMTDGRLSLARMCALQGRLAEAIDWFAKARLVLEEQGARPLRAICDYDEAFCLCSAESKKRHPPRASTSARSAGESTTPVQGNRDARLD